MDLKIRITAILPEKIGTNKEGKQWTSRVIVGETLGQYPSTVAFQAFNKSDLISPLQLGQLVTVFFNPKSREYNGNYYTQLDIWKIEVDGPLPAAGVSLMDAPVSDFSSEDSDDLLPF